MIAASTEISAGGGERCRGAGSYRGGRGWSRANGSWLGGDSWHWSVSASVEN